VCQNNSPARPHLRRVAYTQTFTKDEPEAAGKLGELFGTSWPEIAEKKLISVPNLSQEQEELSEMTQEAFVDQ